MRRLLVLAALGVPMALVLMTCTPLVEAAGAQSAPPSRPAPAAAVLRPGDAVRISVWRRPDLSGEYELAPDGSISDPFYMGLRIANIPLTAATERVRSFVAQYQDSSRVLVQPLFRVGVGGEVRLPNLYLMRPDFTVMQAVMQAGGPTEQANMGQVELFRDGQRTVVNLSDAGGALASQPIRSGDQIVVRRRGNFLRDVLGPLAGTIGAAASIVLVARNRR